MGDEHSLTVHERMVAVYLYGPLKPGGVALMGLTAIPPDAVPKSAVQAIDPKPKSGDIAGVVWRDFKPGGGKAGVVEKGELGLPGVTVQLRDSAGRTQSAKTGADGTFDFSKVPAGSYTADIGSQTFAKPFGGFSWLGPKLITPSLMIAYIWIWAGFAMVVIGAGLAAMPRDVTRSRAYRWCIGVASLPPRHRSAARTGSECRLHHDDHQRSQGLRHRLRPCTGVDAVERERHRRSRCTARRSREARTSASALRSPCSSSSSSCRCSC